MVSSSQTRSLLLLYTVAFAASLAVPGEAAGQQPMVSVYSDVLPASDGIRTYVLASAQIIGSPCGAGAMSMSLEVFGPTAPLYTWSTAAGSALATMLPYTPGSHTAFTSVSTSECGTVLTNAESRELIDVPEPSMFVRAPTSTPLIDGSLTPHLIRDEKAVPMVFRTLAVPEDRGPVASRRFLARVSRMGLSKADQFLLQRELATLHELLLERFVAIAAIRARASGSAESQQAYADAVAASNQANQLTLASYARLLAELSDDGTAKLREYIDLARTRMKVFPQKM